MIRKTETGRKFLDMLYANKVTDEELEQLLDAREFFHALVAREVSAYAHAAREDQAKPKHEEREQC